MPTLFFDDDRVQYEEIQHKINVATGLAAPVPCGPHTSSQILGNINHACTLSSSQFSLD